MSIIFLVLSIINNFLILGQPLVLDRKYLVLATACVVFIGDLVKSKIILLDWPLADLRLFSIVFFELPFGLFNSHNSPLIIKSGVLCDSVRTNSISVDNNLVNNSATISSCSLGWLAILLLITTLCFLMLNSLYIKIFWFGVTHPYKITSQLAIK